MSDSSSEEEELHLPSLFADILPIPQDDGLRPLAQIAYAPEYSEAMGYLRALMSIPEYSQRSVDLTAHIISMNPAHYTCWNFRLKSLFGLADEEKKIRGEEGEKEVLRNEIAFLNRTAVRNEKNYQIWHHRQLVIDRLGEDQGETEFIGKMFELDSKNYHVWSYRQWLVKRFGIWDRDDGLGELKYCEQLIQKDVRNNSAWNHRWFVVFGKGGEVGKEVIDREIGFAQNAIYLSPQNASPWNYLRGILSKFNIPLSTVHDFCQQFAPLDPPNDSLDTVDVDTFSSSHALEVLSEIYAEKESSAEQYNAKKANLALDLLVKKFDPIRKNYWEWRRREMLGEEAVGCMV